MIGVWGKRRATILDGLKTRTGYNNCGDGLRVHDAVLRSIMIQVVDHGRD